MLRKRPRGWPLGVSLGAVEATEVKVRKVRRVDGLIMVG